METNIVQEVYDILEDGANTLRAPKAKLRDLEEKIHSGNYTNQGVSSLGSEASEIKYSINQASGNIIKRARERLAEYQKEIEAENRLDPSQLTDDTKLMQPGIVLKKADIEAMLERNADNKTMTQIILRYAQEKDIKLDGVFYIGGQREIETAKNLNGILDYYERWLPTDKAVEMLEKFFEV